jgi:hypothetical protein
MNITKHATELSMRWALAQAFQKFANYLNTAGERAG